MSEQTDDPYLDAGILEELKVESPVPRPFNRVSLNGVKHYQCKDGRGRKLVLKAGEDDFSFNRLHHEFKLAEVLRDDVPLDPELGVLLFPETSARVDPGIRFYYVTEWFDGTVSELLAEKKRLEPFKAKMIFCDLLHALSILSSQNIIHHSVTTDAVCVSGLDTRRPKVWLSDFFFADRAELSREVAGDQIEYFSPVLIHNGCCRENLQVSSMQRRYSSNADTWSALVVFYAMLFGETPFKSFMKNRQNQTYSRIWMQLEERQKSGQFLPVPGSGHSVPSAYVSFLRKYLILDLSKLETLSPETLLEDPFLADAKNPALSQHKSKLEAMLTSSELRRSTLNASLLNASLLNLSQLECSGFGKQEGAGVSFQQQKELFDHFEQLAAAETSRVGLCSKVADSALQLATKLADSSSHARADPAASGKALLAALKLQLLAVAEASLACLRLKAVCAAASSGGEAPDSYAAFKATEACYLRKRASPGASPRELAVWEAVKGHYDTWFRNRATSAEQSLQSLGAKAASAQRLLEQLPQLARQVADPLSAKVLARGLKLADAELLPAESLKQQVLGQGAALAQAQGSLAQELQGPALGLTSQCFSLREALKSLPGSKVRNPWAGELGKLQSLRKEEMLLRKKALLKKGLLQDSRFTAAAALVALLLFLVALLAALNANL